MKPLDQNNLPFDPAQEAGAHSHKMIEEMEAFRRVSAMLLRQLNEDSQEDENKDESLDQHSTANENAKTANPRCNELEIEEDEKRDGRLRLLRMRHQSKAFRAQTLELLQSGKNNPK